jgi:hypothetical protein
VVSDEDEPRLPGPFHVPLGLARELICDCARAVPLPCNRGEWIAGVITTLLGVPVERVLVHERRAARGETGNRYADITVFDVHAAQLRDVFPEARRLHRTPSRGVRVFRLRC